MKKNRFYRCEWFTFYEGQGLIMFRIFNWVLSFRHINDYKFTEQEKKEPEGWFFYYWLINFKKK